MKEYAHPAHGHRAQIAIHQIIAAEWEARIHAKKHYTHAPQETAAAQQQA